MKELVIGGDGFIGSRLCAALGAPGTSRRPGASLYFDLCGTEPVPEAEVTYIAACVIRPPEVNGYDGWRANVDGTIRVINEAAAIGFVVWLSSGSVCFRSDAYARHKAQVELYMLCTAGRGAIVRICSQVNDDNIGGLLQFIAKVGNAKKDGLFEWTAP